MENSLRWRLRRGMKELDVLFERYAKLRYETSDAAERQAFEQLVTHEDPEIYAWLMNQATPPGEYGHVLAQIRRHD